jgi:hypothetical protein
MLAREPLASLSLLVRTLHHACKDSGLLLDLLLDCILLDCILLDCILLDCILLLDLSFDLAWLEPPQLVTQGLLGPEDLVLFLSLPGLPGDEHVPQPVRVAVELAASFAILAGGRLFARCRAVLGPVLEAGAAETFILVHVARQLAPGASARAFQCRAVGRGESEAGGADIVKNVDITLDPAVAATMRAAARRAKFGVLGAAGAHASVDI